MKTFIADKKCKLIKLALYHFEELTFSQLMKCLRKKDVKVNGKRVNENITLSVGDKVEIFYVEKSIEKFSILYKDDNVLIINKLSGFTSETIFNDIKKTFSTASFIHRLDRNTSGIMIFALTSDAEKELLAGFKNRAFEKKYTAMVVGKLSKKQDILTAYLIKDKDNALVKIYDKKVNGSVMIKTGYSVLEEKEDISKLSITLYTGKTHQIRAHFAHIGHPILGDGKYGDYNMNQKYKQYTQNLSATELTLHFEKTDKLYYLNNKKFIIKG